MIYAGCLASLSTEKSPHSSPALTDVIVTSWTAARVSCSNFLRLYVTVIAFAVIRVISAVFLKAGL